MSNTPGAGRLRPVREVTAAAEEFRLEPIGPGVVTPRRNPVEPEPVGTVVVTVHRITGYDQDCDGGLMARMRPIDRYGAPLGPEVLGNGLHPDSTLVIEHPSLLWMPPHVTGGVAPTDDPANFDHRLHVILGMDPDEYEDALLVGRMTPDWRGMPISLEPSWHSHPALGIPGHSHGHVEQARRIHAHRPEVGWDSTPVFFDAEAAGG